jgi:hypothetical protein
MVPALDMSFDPWKVVPCVFVGYWILCRSLRWRRINAILDTYKGRDPYSLSVSEAQSIVQDIFQLELCHMSRFSTAFALFRTYGIGSIAEILIKYIYSSIKQS